MTPQEKRLTERLAQEIYDMVWLYLDDLGNSEYYHIGSDEAGRIAHCCEVVVRDEMKKWFTFD